MSPFQIEKIGTFYCEDVETYLQPHQPQSSQAKRGRIVLEPQCNYEQALEDLIDFERIWLIFGFHKAHGWKTKVLPPRNSGDKKGVFATRSPHRPNHLGMSCVELKRIQGRELIVENHDLLNDTPIYDIKPYLPYCDSHPTSKAGWVDAMKEKEYSIHWSAIASKQLEWLKLRFVHLDEWSQTTLQYYPNSEEKRVKCLSKERDEYELAIKTWRMLYRVDVELNRVEVKRIYSGYDLETLKLEKKSAWDDVELHIEYGHEFDENYS